MGLANVRHATIPSLSPSMNCIFTHRRGTNFTAYVSFGGAYVNIYTLTGPAISGPVRESTSARSASQDSAFRKPRLSTTSLSSIPSAQRL